MSLYEIPTEFYDILQKEELTEEDMKRIDELSQDETQKAIIIAGYIKNITNDIEAIAQAVQSMQKRMKRLDNKADFLVYKVKEKMRLLNTDCIDESPNFEIKIQKNPPHVHVIDETLIPFDYWRRKETKTINRELIMDDIKGLGRNIPGVELVADTKLVIK